MGKEKIIVSLTSWKKRIDTVDVVVKAMKRQTVKVDKIVLYLAEDEFADRKLPTKLTKLCDDQFEIRWTKNIGSYKKLIPALKDFPNDIVVTVDDDLYFDDNLVKLLLDGYRKYPHCIQVHRITTVNYYNNKRIVTILDSKETYGEPNVLYKLTGGAGALYPPHCFYKDIDREDLFMELAPEADDLWFWIQGLLGGYKVNLVDGHFSNLKYIGNTQDVAMCKRNDVGGNESPFLRQFKNLLRHYPKIRRMLWWETLRIRVKRKLHMV